MATLPTAVRRVASSVSVVALVAIGMTLVGPSVTAGAADGGAAITIAGGGYGHGVGMSQFGARGRADAGQTAADILGAYYPGIALANLAPAGPRVLIGSSSSFRLIQPAGAVNLQQGGVTVATIGAGEIWQITISGGTVTAQRVGPTWAEPVTASVGNAPVTVTLTPGAPTTLVASTISSAGRRYQRGRLVVNPRTSTADLVVDQLTMQEFLYGLAEMSSSWPVEALRAQAIAGRSYTAYRLAHPAGSTYDITSFFDEAYTGAEIELASGGSRWVQAVADTDGLVATYGGQPIQAFWSSSNGGASERSDYVFVTALPYLVAAADPYDAATGNANASWTRTYTSDELRAWIRASGRPDPGPITGVEIGGNIGASGRVDRATVVVRGSAGAVTVTGNQFRSLVNSGAPSSRDLLSTKFSVVGAPPAPPPNRLPTGNLELAGNFFGVTLAVGWASDPDTPDQPVTVLLTVGNAWAAIVPANRDRPDVGAHGWATLAGLPRTSVVCALAIDTSGSGFTKLGCITVVK